MKQLFEDTLIEEAKRQREADEKYAREQDKVVMDTMLKPEDVKKQPHYTNVGMEPKVYIMANQMGFAEGNVIKYVSRYKLKGTPVKDLMKARDYIDWLIEEARKSSAD